MRLYIPISFEIKIPHWLAKFFPCEHEIVSVEHNFNSRYGTRTSYAMCIKCGKKLDEAQKSCRHRENCFGECSRCLKRLSKHDCKHKWTRESDTDDYFCKSCGAWKDMVEL